MKQHSTPNASKSIELMPRTAQFSTLEHPIMELISEIIDNAGSLLNWRPRSVAVAHEILRRMGGEQITLEYTMMKLGMAIRPDLEPLYASRYMARYVKMLEADMEKSGFHPVKVEIGARYQLANGTWARERSKYSSGSFQNLLRHCQDEAIKTNFADWNLNKRRKKLREIIGQWLKAEGCTPIPIIPRKKREPAKVIDMGERVTLRDVEKRIGAAFDALSAAGVDWLNLGKALPDYVRKLHSLTIDVEIRLHNVRSYQNAHQQNGKIKFKGAQPK